MRGRAFAGITVFVFTLFFISVDGKLVDFDSFEVNSHWAYLGKFCYEEHTSGNSPLRLSVRIQKPPLSYKGFDVSDQSFYVYCENEDSSACKGWKNVYESDDSCGQRTGQATAKLWTINDLDDMVTYTHSFSTARPRFFYVALANCNAKKLYVPYIELSFTNGGGYLQDEVSFDQQWLFLISLILLIVYGIFLFLAYIWKRKAKALGRQYRAIQGITLLCLVAVPIHLFRTIHQGMSAADGKGYASLKVVASVLEATFDAILFFIILCLAKGRTISSNHVPIKSIFLGCCGYWVVFTALWILAWEYYDEATEVFPMDGGVGLASVFCALVGPIIFITLIRNSYKAETNGSKRRFYVSLGIMSTLIWLAAPVSVALAILTDRWYREKIVFLARWMLLVGGTIALLGLFRPTPSNLLILSPDVARAFRGTEALVFSEVAVQRTINPIDVSSRMPTNASRAADGVDRKENSNVFLDEFTTDKDPDGVMAHNPQDSSASELDVKHSVGADHRQHDAKTAGAGANEDHSPESDGEASVLDGRFSDIESLSSIGDAAGS